MILHYDGSLDGFLCLLGDAIKQRFAVTRICAGQKQVSAALFEEERTIITDRTWAATVADGLQNKLGRRFMKTLIQALYSEAEEIELDLLQLARRALKGDSALLDRLADPLVNRITTSAQRTARESHRLLGLLRFQQLADDSYLAVCTPRSNAVPLLGRHFNTRFKGMRWAILDEQRKIGLFGRSDGWRLFTEVEVTELIMHADEQQVTELWRNFYHSISNPDRHNPKLRQQFMPKRYWSYLTELQPADEFGQGSG